MVHPELCQNGTLRVTVGIRWGYGGGTEGERCGSGIVEECLQCAIFGTQSRPALIVKPKSLP